MAARPRRTERNKVLRLACWNADGVRGRKLEIGHFLNQHGVDICLLSEAFLNPGQAFRPANYVCHPTDRLTVGGQHSNPVPPWYSPPLSTRSMTHLEATAIQVIIDGRPVKILAAYLSPSRPLIGADLTASFGGRLPVLLAADLNAKHVEWNSRLNTGRDKLLRDYTYENSCLIFGPGTQTTNPYNPSATPDVLDIVITTDLSFAVYLTSCSALSSDYLPVLIENACRLSSQHPPDRRDFRRTDRANFQTHLEDQIPFDRELHNGIAIVKCVENFSGPVLKALAASTPKCRPRDDPRPPIPIGIHVELA